MELVVTIIGIPNGVTVVMVPLVKMIRHRDNIVETLKMKMTR